MPTAHTARPGPISPRRDRSGFTLVEMLVVVVIIVILVGLLVPALSGARNSAKKAATRSQMQAFLSAIATYRADKQALPGVWGVSQIGDRTNLANDSIGYGISMMQSVILDLAGGIVGRGNNATITDSANEFEMQIPRVSVNHNINDRVVVDLRRIGSTDGPQYLQLNKDNFGTPEGRVFQNKHYVKSTENTFFKWARIPEMIDGNGMPVLLWMQDPLASAGDTFASLSYNSQTNNQTPPHSKFYWGTNANALSSRQLGPGRINQSYESCLGRPGPSSAASQTGTGQGSTASDVDVVMTLQALLGNSAFPTYGQPPQEGPTVNIINTPPDIKYPAVARGEIILHAAGNDQIYLRKTGNRTRAVFDDSAPSLEKGRLIDEFDDFVEAQ